MYWPAISPIHRLLQQHHRLQCIVFHGGLHIENPAVTILLVPLSPTALLAIAENDRG